MPGSVKGLSVGRSLIPGERGAGGGCLGLSFTNWYLLSDVFPVVSLFLIFAFRRRPPTPHHIYKSNDRSFVWSLLELRS